MNQNKTIAVIPAYNESRTIREVVLETAKYVDKVVVVDDGSEDDTYLNATEYAVVLRQKNSGPGLAVRNGIVQFVTSDVLAVITLDSDGQHNPKDIIRMVEKVREGYDVAIGTRSLKRKETPFSRWLVNKGFYILRNFGHKQKLRDAECGFRVFSRKALGILDIETNRFGFCEEIAIKARALSLKIVELPIETTYGEEQAKNTLFKNYRQGFGVLYSILKWRWIYEWCPHIIWGIHDRYQQEKRKCGSMLEVRWRS